MILALCLFVFSNEIDKIRSMDKSGPGRVGSPVKKGAAKAAAVAKRGVAAKKKVVPVKDVEKLDDPIPASRLGSPKLSLASIALPLATPLVDPDEPKIGVRPSVSGIGAADSDSEEFQREFRELENLIFVDKTRPYPQILSELEQIESENSAAIRLGITSKKKREIPTRLLVELQDAAKVSLIIVLLKVSL